MRHLSALAHRGRSLSTVAFRSTTSKALDCSDPKLAFSSYSTFELLRGATVLTACSQPWLVKHSEPLLALSDRVLGRKATEALLRHSVFAHFVAGETAETIAPTLRGLREKGVGGILDYAAEADLESEGGTDVTVNQPARSYPYVSEAHFNANRRIFLSAVNAVHATTPEGFAAVKVTALGDPALLERVSTAVRELRAFFETLDPAKQGVISRDAFRRGWREAFEMSDEEIEAVFERIDTDMDGNVDLASHNKASIERVAALLLGESLGDEGGERSRVARERVFFGQLGEHLGEGGGERSRVARERVYFGQLLGMGDNLTFTLARHALKAYKYVSEDPSREALPWALMASRTASLQLPPSSGTYLTARSARCGPT